MRNIIPKDQHPCLMRSYKTYFKTTKNLLMSFPGIRSVPSLSIEPSFSFRARCLSRPSTIQFS